MLVRLIQWWEEEEGVGQTDTMVGGGRGGVGQTDTMVGGGRGGVGQTDTVVGGRGGRRRGAVLVRQKDEWESSMSVFLPQMSSQDSGLHQTDVWS